MSTAWANFSKDFGDYCRARALASDGAELERLTARASVDVQQVATRAAIEPLTTVNNPAFSGIALPFIQSLGQSSILDRLLAEDVVTRMPYTATGAAVSLISIAGGGVGELAPKPVRSANFAAATLAHHKAICLVVASEEWLRGVGASEALASEIRRALSQATNAVFLDALAAVADTIPSTGSTAAAIAADLTTAVTTLGVHENSHFVAAVDPTTYAEVSLKPSSATVGPLAFEAFPTVGVVTFMASESLTNTAIVFDSARLGVGDGGLMVDQSRHGSLQMDDAPSGASASFSLWQRNARGIRAERLFSIAFATPDSSGSLPAVQITGAW